MFIHPAAIVALVLYLIVGQLTVSQQFQTRFKSLGHGVHQKISSVLSLPRAAFEPQDYPLSFEATTVEALPIVPVETNLIHPVETVSTSPVPPEDYVEAVIQEVYPARYDDHPSPVSARVFVMSSECQGPFNWGDLLNYRVFEVLTAICFSVWFPWVVIPSVAKLLSRSESRDEAEQPIDTLPELLPPKFLVPPATAQIRIINPKSHAPPKPIFSPAPPEPSTFWLASKRKQQDQPSTPSPPLLRLLHLSHLENEAQNKLSPLSSPADSGYGTTLPGTASDVSSLVFGGSVITTPEHLTTSLTASAELILVHDSNNVTTTTYDDFTGEEIDTAEFDTELEDDDGSTTVTNSTANLADLIIRPPVSAEVLAAKLECVTVALIEETKSLPEPPTEEPSVTIPPSDDSTADLPSRDVDERDATGTGSKEGETRVEVDFPSQDNLEQEVEPWTPDYEIPFIAISPPSDVDSEDEQEESEGTVGLDFGKSEPESEDDDEPELEYADDYPDHPVAEVVLELPLSPVEVRDDPCRSPIIKTGKLWSDDESDDPGPLPLFGGITHVEVYDILESPNLKASDVAEITEPLEAIDTVEQVEARCSPVEEETPDTASATSEDLNIEEPVTEAAQQPVEEPQPALEALPQKVVEPAPAEPIPSTSTSSGPQNPLHTSRSKRARTKASSDNGDRGEGSSRNRKTPENPRLQCYHCCSLYKSGGRPKSWENWELEKDCIPNKTNLQEWQFVRPTDRDGENPTTRIAIDNLDAGRFQTVEGVLSYDYLTDAMGFFSTKSYRCWRGRSINDREYSSIGYATVDFDSVGEAIRMFDELQGRRLRGHTWHWRLEFVDPRDETHGGRRIVREELVPDSVKQALAAELEASTRRRGKSGYSDDTSNAGVTRPPAKVRPQLSTSGRSLFAGAMSNVVQDRRTGERAAQSTRVPSRRPYRS